MDRYFQQPFPTSSITNDANTDGQVLVTQVISLDKSTLDCTAAVLVANAVVSLQDQGN
jgi:hypothetical protein